MAPLQFDTLRCRKTIFFATFFGYQLRNNSRTFIRRSKGNIDVAADQELEVEKRENYGNLAHGFIGQWAIAERAEGKGASIVAIDDHQVIQGWKTVLENVHTDISSLAQPNTENNRTEKEVPPEMLYDTEINATIALLPSNIRLRYVRHYIKYLVLA